MKRLLMTLFVVLSFCILMASSCFAAISTSDQTAILSGISGSDTLYYALGGGLLVVMAGIWGFKRVKALLGN